MFGPVPVLNKKHIPSSIHIVPSYLSGAMPASLNLYMGVVDLRDVAALQVVAMKISTRVLSVWLTKVLGMFNPQIAIFVSELGKRKITSCEKAARVLGSNLVRAREEVIVDTAQSLIDLGLVKH